MATYADVLARLVTARRFGVVLGLPRMRALLDKLGSPDTHLGRVIHVGGTNGKGSTVAMLAHIARTAGLRVAAYTSPHLNELRERIAFDGAPIAYSSFVAAAERVSAAGGDELTFFEQVTAIACVAIAAARPDVTILEVGLGGRLDATNAIASDVAVVTGVAMDHEAILGDTLAKIAAEKAGIFKWQLSATSLPSSLPAVPITETRADDEEPLPPIATSMQSRPIRVASSQRIVIGASGEPDAVPVLVAAARGLGVEPVVIDDDHIARVPPVVLVGEHQRANAACALAALDALADTLPADASPRWSRLRDPKVHALALSTVTHPGRFEIIRTARLRSRAGKAIPLGLVILDGAHNPHGAAQLARTLVARDLRPTLVLGVSNDKDVAAMVRALLPAVGDVVATRYQQERAMPPADLVRVIAEVSAENDIANVTPIAGSPDVRIVTKSEITEDGALVASLGNTRTCHVEPDLTHAIHRAAQSPDYAPILVAGSLFLVGEARALLLGVPSDPIVATDPAVKR